ncbi:putative ATP synthase subunit f, mitochondrial [Physella acuta]|uniref:putative ATP synthase subunit f, mitochondrial n=1 Tax=Physella acuta TaxID=109671 RepID=UPI0027DEA93E|nr:putative ATP synthase subunit f, mitochondrial [Physella acuta]
MTYEPGKYPREYNPKVHGPYHPGRFYGKPDTPLAEVKLGELGSWLSRRNKSPNAIWGAIHRGYWQWASKYYHVRLPGFVPYAQVIMGLSAYYFFYLYADRKYHRHARYH